MPEITLKLDDPAKTAQLLRQAARYAGSDGWDHLSARHAHWLANQIEEALARSTRPRFCDKTPNCRMAAGHNGGCERS